MDNPNGTNVIKTHIAQPQAPQTEPITPPSAPVETQQPTPPQLQPTVTTEPPQPQGMVPPKEPYHNEEFEAFLKNIGNAKLKNWSIYARALGVSRQTIERWKKHPLAQMAITEAISENLQEMERVGATDWKMHREKLKMFGLEEVTEVKISSTDINGVIGKIEKTNYDELGKLLGKQNVAPAKPVQDKK